MVIDERMSTGHCWDDPGPQYWERKISGFAAVRVAVDTGACLGLRLGCLDEKPPTVHLSQGTDISAMLVSAVAGPTFCISAL